MAEASNFLASKRYAVVTGGNKGIGFEICKQLALKEITVVLTARDAKRGLDSVEKLIKECGFSSDILVFHQLDVTDSASVASLADFIKTKFGKLDILVNNAGILGAMGNADAFVRAVQITGDWPEGEHVNWKELVTQTFETAEECLNTNYYGAKRMVEALAPLLQLSDSARIVNISSFLGLLERIPNEKVKGALSNAESLTEEKIDEILNKLLKDVKQGSVEKEGPLTVAQGADGPVKLALLPYVIFHQLDVTDPASIASLADFIKTQFGKLDILVNNAAYIGAVLSDAFVKASEAVNDWPGEHCSDWNELATQNFEMADECLKTNYYGAKRMIEAHISLLQLSDSPRIVNVSSLSGLLKNIENEYAKTVLNDVENLTEEKIDELLNKFMKDFKEGSLEKEGWRTYVSTYTVSKAALNAYTRLLANKYPDFLVNSVCPGYVKTDINAILACSLLLKEPNLL